MLPAAHRLRDGDGFRAVTRRGVRAKTHSLVAYLRLPDIDVAAGGDAALVGFVVGRGVGSAVCRNRVKRRLRHLVRQRLDVLPDGSAMVVRALPASAFATSRELAGDLDRALVRFGLARP